MTPVKHFTNLRRVTDVDAYGTEIGSHIEPPLDPAMPAALKLQWMTAVIRVDTGLDIQVVKRVVGGWAITGHGYTWTCGGWAAAWRDLSALSTGAQMMRRKLERE